MRSSSTGKQETLFNTSPKTTPGQDSSLYTTEYSCQYKKKSPVLMPVDLPDDAKANQALEVAERSLDVALQALELPVEEKVIVTFTIVSPEKPDVKTVSVQAEKDVVDVYVQTETSASSSKLIEPEELPPCKCINSEKPTLSFNKYWVNRTKGYFKEYGIDVLHEAALLKCGYSKVSRVVPHISADPIEFDVYYQADPTSEKIEEDFSVKAPYVEILQELKETIRLNQEKNCFYVAERSFVNLLQNALLWHNLLRF